VQDIYNNEVVSWKISKRNDNELVLDTIEMLYLYHFKTEADLIQAIEEYIYFYNYKRFQKRLNHRAPIEYRISMAA
ncbi:IS3 family transposase, partial [Streptomyces griseus]|uniref:IS3 family transposase n=1 Tax=Streptomyces griseus TaxID=1911 RepID=UPI001C559811